MKFGVIVNNDFLKLWQLELIKGLVDGGHTLEAVIKPSKNSNDRFAHSSKISRYLGKNGFFNLYEKFFLSNGLLTNVDASSVFHYVKVVEVNILQIGKYSQSFDNDSVAEVGALGLDIILRFGLNIIKGDILNAAKYGIWSFHHDDEQLIRGGPPGFWEIFERHDVNGILIQRLTEKLDSGYLVMKTFVPVIRHSYNTHLNELLRIGVQQMILAFNKVSACESFSQSKVQFQELSSSAKIYRKPSNIQMVNFLFLLFLNKVSFHFKDLFRHENWNIGFGEGDFSDFSKSIKELKINWLSSNENSFFKADPFLVKLDEGLNIVYEHYSYKKSRAYIASQPLQSKINVGKPLINENHHLAFPSIIDIDDQQYCVPESIDSGKSYIYKVEPLTGKMSSIAYLNLKFPAVDPVIFRFEGRFWLFCTHKPFGTSNNLFIYHTDSLMGNWMGHPKNPVKTDVRNSRMAGNIFKFEEHLIRPAQCNDLFYGNGLVFNKITKLTDLEYEEEEIFALKPSFLAKFNKGVHTINFKDGFFVIDGKDYKFVFSEFRARLKRKFFRR